MKEIAETIKAGRLIVGTKRTIKGIRKGTVEKVLLAKNAPETIVEDIEHYCKLTETAVETLDIECDELGTVCKKPFKNVVLQIIQIK